MLRRPAPPSTAKGNKDSPSDLLRGGFLFSVRGSVSMTCPQATTVPDTRQDKPYCI